MKKSALCPANLPLALGKCKCPQDEIRKNNDCRLHRLYDTTYTDNVLWIKNDIDFIKIKLLLKDEMLRDSI